MQLRTPLVRAVRAYSSSTSSSSTSSSSLPLSNAAAPMPAIIPFPAPYHVGIDLCSIARVHRLLRTRPAQFIQRVMTPREIAELPGAVHETETEPQETQESTKKRISPLMTLSILASPTSVIPRVLQAQLDGDASASASANSRGNSLWRAASYLAGRFAAKEAAIKAHPHVPSLTFQSIRIGRAHQDTEHRNGSGPPVAFVTLPPTATDDTPVEQEARLSISHDGQYATAMCLGFQAS